MKGVKRDEWEERRGGKICERKGKKRKRDIVKKKKGEKV
jgi:hypothetical protein